MAVFKPFCGVRPKNEYAQKVAALPYDVMSSEEAREAVKGNPLSFLHVDKAEIDLPESTYIYDESVYLKAKENLEKLTKDGICIQDENPCFYIYRQIMDGRSQTGLVGCAGIDDYINGIIKKHELTRADKEEDRIRHVDTCNANTGPIFLTYSSDGETEKIISSWQETHSPVYDFADAAGVQQTVWVIDDAEINEKLRAVFDKTPALYIADGHHRCASAVKVGIERRKQNPGYTGEEEFNFFLAVAFPAQELAIMDYNRVVHDLNGKTAEEYLKEIEEKFYVQKQGAEPYKPQEQHTFGMYLEGEWYSLKAKEGTFSTENPVDSLDVSILQKNLLDPVLGIKDPRTDKRIDFVGGIRGLEELKIRADKTGGTAFAVYPVTVKELMDIADANMIMPPKSTWFEPKLLSGLFIHPLS